MRRVAITLSFWGAAALAGCGGENAVCPTTTAPAATSDPAAEENAHLQAEAAAEQERERRAEVARQGADHPCDDLSIAECVRACDEGGQPACVHLGEMYTRGERVPRDPTVGGRMLRHACEEGSVRGCYEHGMYFQYSDPVAAADSLVKACSGEDESGRTACATYLAMVDQRRIVPSDADLGAVAGRACDAGMRSACGRLKEAH
jgi:TPR repeat protein